VNPSQDYQFSATGDGNLPQALEAGALRDEKTNA
jgi:hypothetical protein